MKRILVALALALAAATSFGATKYSLSLMDATGSTSGQVIASTGPTTAPAWTTVTLAGIGGILPVLNGGTGVTTAAAEVTRLSAAVTTGTLAQFAPTTSAQLAGVISDETGTGSAVFGTSPTIATPNITGVVNGSNAAAGSVGQYATPTDLTGVTLPAATATNASSVSLTAGNWDVACTVTFTPPGGVAFTTLVASISTTSGGTTNGTGTRTSLILPFTISTAQELSTPTVKEFFTSTTTVYCTGFAAYSSGSATVSGVMRAVRTH